MGFIQKRNSTLRNKRRRNREKGMATEGEEAL